jgi:hypothetical protein
MTHVNVFFLPFFADIFCCCNHWNDEAGVIHKIVTMKLFDGYVILVISTSRCIPISSLITEFYLE